MCGIFGIMTGNKRYTKADDYISDSFVGSSLRGMDSCGVVNIEMKRDLYSLHKLPVNGSYFITDRGARSVIKDANTANSLTLAHTRAATQGGVNINNAHPFVAEGKTDNGWRELVGVHNGSLTGWATSPGGKDYDVDSEWALNKIFEKGMKAFDDFYGAYCFVWWDSEDSENLHIALNDQRPMHICFLKDGGMAFASEAGMLAWMLERNKIERDGNILELSSNFHYTFNVDNPKEFKKEEIKKAVTTRTYPQTNRSVYASCMDKVKAVLDKVREDGEFIHRPFVTKGEVERASAENVQGVKGVFIPSYYDDSTKELLGTFVPDGSSKDTADNMAAIRNAQRITFGPTTEFNVSILGVADDATNTLLCTYPKATLVKAA